MEIRTIVSVVAVVLVLGAAGWYYQDPLRDLAGRLAFDIPFIGNDDEGSEAENFAIEAEEGSTELVEEQRDEVAELTEEFVEHYEEALRDNDEDAAREARELLSWRGTTVVDRDESVVAGLKRLTRDLETPTNIEVLEARKVSDDFAEASARWEFASGEPVTRYFYFVVEDGEWKIDSLQMVQQ